MKRAAVVLTCLVGACRSPSTEMYVSISADPGLSIPTDIDTLQIEVRDTDAGATTFSQMNRICSAGNTTACWPMPLSVNLIPGMKKGDTVLVQVTASAGGNPVIQDAASFAFTDGLSQELDFVLYRACLNSDCAQQGGQSCGDDGRCHPLHPQGTNGGSDGGTDGGSLGSSCAQQSAHPEWLVCDGFDGPDLDPVWDSQSQKGEVTIDPTVFVRGSGAARFHFDTATAQPTSERALIQRAISQSGPLFIRLFVKVPVATTNNVMEGELAGLGDQGFAHGALLQNAAGNAVAINTFGATTTYGPIGGRLSPTDWTCVEWEVPTMSGATNVWIGDQALTGFEGNISFPVTLDTFHLGCGANVVNGQDGDFWIDDLVISTQRVTCGN
jgi:hypothetical protein